MKPNFALMKNDIKLWLAFGAGSGLTKTMPGTLGTFAGMLIFFVMLHISTKFTFIILLIITAIAPKICDYASQKLNAYDSPNVVLDEIVAIGWVLFFLPQNPWLLILAFLLFRFFDIVKPPPIDWVDNNFKSGLGMMLDDYLAAIYTIISIKGIATLFG